jgi:predicted transcriptional regulator
LYDRVQQDPASPLPQVVQARWRLAEQARANNGPRDEQQWLRSLRQADAAGGAARNDTTRTLSARAGLRLADPLLQAYRQVLLVEPLKASLARKQARFDAVQAAYADAAATGSAAGQALATAASADLYADFGRAVLASQRPRGLKKADAESYTVLLQEQAQPFEDRAADLHRANAERTRQGQWDDGVRASYAALRSLRPLRWDKHEAAPVDDGSATTRALRQALADREAGRFADARRTLEGLLASDASNQPARLNLAILLDLYQHDAAAALPHYQALAPSPALPALPRWIAELQTRVGRPALAVVPEVRR